jgi:peroxiredoxin
MNRQKIALMILAAVMITSAFALPSVTAHRKSPEFTIAEPSGRTTMLSGFKGKVVIMEFLFVKSQHCLRVATTLNKLNSELGARRFQAVGIVFDPPTLRMAASSFYLPWWII